MKEYKSKGFSFIYEIFINFMKLPWFHSFTVTLLLHCHGFTVEPGYIDFDYNEILVVMNTINLT